MRLLNPESIAEHNRLQREYFERTVKRTMVPRDSPYLRRHVEEIIRFGQISPADRVLEVGCGMGRCTLLLAQRGVRVEGLDLSPLLLERLREYNGGRFNIPLHCADLSRPPKELGGQFDAVVGFFTLHHLHDVKMCIEAMKHLLKPGGRMVFLEPNPYYLFYYFQVLFTPRMEWQGEKGILQMRPGVVLRAMQETGLSKPSLTRFGLFPPFLANQSWGSRLEAALEKPSIWQNLLAFQLIRGERPS